LYVKALTLNQELNHKEGIAIDYGRLGQLYQRRGNLDAAENSYRESLEINRELGRKRGIAAVCRKLGDVYTRMQKLGLAEDMYRESLGISRGLNDTKGMFRDYSLRQLVYTAGRPGPS
jgi:tetratricopeptide (TPR) repeat protein